jgi:hypothetical protein
MGFLANLLATPVIGAILGPLINGLLTAQKQKLEAEGSHEARVADLAQRQLSLDTREAEVNAQVVIAEQGNWVTRSVRPLFALPFILFTWKVIVWDKLLAGWTHGNTDPLDPQMWGVFMSIVIAFFGGRSVEKVADKIAGVFKK